MFKEFKNVFEFSMYLDNVPKTYRIAFTKLRLSSHPLRIETGRYGNDRINQNQRYCLICGSGDIEDEYHFVCICKPYETIRKHYLKKTYYVRPSVAKFIDLLQTINKSVLLRLCKFIHEAFVIRSHIVNNIL